MRVHSRSAICGDWQVTGFGFILFLLGAAFAVSAHAEQDLSQQIKLSESQISGFIAAQSDISKVSNELQATGDKLTPEMTAKLDAIAARHGFKDFTDLNLVAANIGMILSGFDPDTGDYTDHRDDLKLEIEDVKSASDLDIKERQDVLKSLEKELAETPEVKFPENIDLIRKHREAIEKALE